MKDALKYSSLLVIVMLVLAACAGSPAATPAPAEAPAQDEAAVDEAASDEVVTITFWDNRQSRSRWMSLKPPIPISRWTW
jgi:ABC-type glycerol-3-phosphate transport system substrate-binding protein